MSSNSKVAMPQFNLNYINSTSVSFDEAKEYLLKYFVVLSNGNHAMLKGDGTYDVMKDEILSKLYLKRVSKELKEYYQTKNYVIRELTYELNRETLYDNYLNLCPKMKHTYLPYEESFSTSTKKGVALMLSFIKEVIVNNHDASNDFIIKWLSNMIKGNKNNSCVYLKGIQGIGKSSFTDFIKYWVIGEKLTLETGSSPLKEKFNSILEGKLMVCFEELENVSSAEWMAMSSSLKRIITSDTILVESKNVNSYQTKNINNYFILSNNDAIKDDDGRRYFIADVSTKRQGDFNYFAEIRNTCFNDDVGSAFYSYLMEIDTEGFNPQQYPMTSSKLDSIAKRLESPYMFLKDEYVLQNLELKELLKDLYDSYCNYCKMTSQKRFTKIDFNKKLKEIDIIPKDKSNSKCNKYYCSKEDLLNIFKKKNWIHELDDFDAPQQSLFQDDAMASLQKENELLRKELEELRNQMAKEEADDGEEVITEEVEVRDDLIVDYDEDELDAFLSNY